MAESEIPSVKSMEKKRSLLTDDYCYNDLASVTIKSRSENTYWKVRGSQNKFTSTPNLSAMNAEGTLGIYFENGKVVGRMNNE
jgi:hypothetical protein